MSLPEFTEFTVETFRKNDSWDFKRRSLALGGVFRNSSDGLLTGARSLNSSDLREKAPERGERCVSRTRYRPPASLRRRFAVKNNKSNPIRKQTKLRETRDWEMLKNMTIKNVLDFFCWRVPLSVKLDQTADGLILCVPLWCTTADEIWSTRRALFMETLCLSSSVIHKSKHRLLNRMCSIKQRQNQWAAAFDFSGNIDATLHHIRSASMCVQPGWAPPAAGVPHTLPVIFRRHPLFGSATNLQRRPRLPRPEIKVVVVPGAKDLQDPLHLLDVPLTQRTTWGHTGNR